MKKRIWELDAARGLCTLGMVLVHLSYDLQHLVDLLPPGANPVFSFVMEWGGVLFFLISGICATMGSHPVRRGAIVFGCGVLVSAVTYGMVALNLADPSMAIRFGVLQSLGTCMLLWPVFRRLPVSVTGIVGAVIVAAGLYVQHRSFDFAQWLYPLGLRTAAFSSGDYFPLMPFLGFFLLGTVLGKTVYQNKTTLFPNVRPNQGIILFLVQTGRWSLPVYLLHQPVLTGILMLLEVLV